MLAAMERAGAVRLNAREVDALIRVAITTVGEGEHKHDVPHKEFIGQDAAVLARGIGKTVPPTTELLFGETDESNPFVTVEQMMPFIPFVRCRDVDEAIDKAKHYEHGFRHTSLIHSNNVRNMTKMGRVMDTTLFVKNGPCMAALGPGRRRLFVVFDRHAHRRGRDHAADVYPRAALLADRRSANFGQVTS